MKLALAALVVAALWMLSGRRFRVEPRVPAALDDVDWLADDEPDQYVPMVAWDGTGQYATTPTSLDAAIRSLGPTNYWRN